MLTIVHIPDARADQADAACWLWPPFSLQLNAEGWRLYRGLPSWPACAPVDYGSIDYDEPIGWAAPDSDCLTTFGWVDWPAGGRWPVALRFTDEGGAEFAAAAWMFTVEADEAGLAPMRPAAVLLLTARPVAGQRLEVRWRCPAGGASAAAAFQVFVGPLLGQTIDELLACPATATVQAADGAGGRYRWTSGALTGGRACRVAVRAVSGDGLAGPVATASAQPLEGRVAGVGILVAEVNG